MVIILFISLSCFQTALSAGNCDCGQVGKSRIIPRIANGTNVPEGKYPWMISLGHCGGTFITNKHILTAAHCGLYFEGKKIHFGSNDKWKFKGEATIAAANRHPKYIAKAGIEKHDIMILTLTKPVKFNNKVKPICLPAKSSIYNEGYGSGIAAGWGRWSRMLREAKLKIINSGSTLDPDDCKKNGNFVCAKSVGKKYGTEGGDSGGPFMVEENGRYNSSLFLALD